MPRHDPRKKKIHCQDGYSHSALGRCPITIRRAPVQRAAAHRRHRHHLQRMDKPSPSDERSSYQADSACSAEAFAELTIDLPWHHHCQNGCTTKTETSFPCICRTAGTPSLLLITSLVAFYTWFVFLRTSKLFVTTFFKRFLPSKPNVRELESFPLHRYDPGTSEYRAPVEAKRREDPPRRRPYATEQSWPLFLEGIL